MDWLSAVAPSVKDLELGTGGYSPSGHCEAGDLLRDAQGRKKWQAAIDRRGFRVAALNVSGNPLHPDPEISRLHDEALRNTIRLSAAIGVDRIVAMSGCPGAPNGGGKTPHFAASAWLPDFLGVAGWQWEECVLPYWTELSEFLGRESPQASICFELHPGTAVYNVATFLKIAEVGQNLAVNLDPSHLFWQSMDPVAVVGRLGNRIRHCHAKDLVFNPTMLAMNGILDNRWPGAPAEMPWNFATVGRGHGVEWWSGFVNALRAVGFEGSLSIECEDPLVSAEEGILEAARLLETAFISSEQG
jgi:sugar phosphate isomerase/epimerase